MVRAENKSAVRQICLRNFFIFRRLKRFCRFRSALEILKKLTKIFLVGQLESASAIFKITLDNLNFKSRHIQMHRVDTFEQ